MEVIFLDFTSYLKERHLINPNAREMKEVSARQYKSRLKSMIDQNIYSEGNELDELTIDKINNKYANKTKEYDRTIKYYLEFKKYLDQHKGIN